MAVFDDTLPWENKLQLFANKVEWPGNIPLANKAKAEDMPLLVNEPLKLECQHFLDCMRTRQKPLTDGKEGLRVLKVLEQCQNAMDNNKV